MDEKENKVTMSLKSIILEALPSKKQFSRFSSDEPNLALQNSIKILHNCSFVNSLNRSLLNTCTVSGKMPCVTYIYTVGQTYLNRPKTLPSY